MEMDMDQKLELSKSIINVKSSSQALIPIQTLFSSGKTNKDQDFCSDGRIYQFQSQQQKYLEVTLLKAHKNI